MQRLLITTLIALFTFAVNAADRVVNLNDPGALEQVRKDKPDHYRKITTIMEGILSQPAETVPKWLKTKFEAENAVYGPLALTSYPPKKRLSFQLDEVQYHAIVTLTNFKAEVVPAFP